MWALALSCALASAETIRGVVLDGTGAAVAGAEVKAINGKMLLTRRTASDGSFRIENVTAGDWSLRVTAPGYAPATVTELNGSAITVRLKAAVEQSVVVIARRMETEVSETAESVTLFDATRLKESSAFTLDSQLRQSPGFNLFRRSDSLSANPTSQGVSFRGVGASGASRSIVLADEIPLNDPFGGWVYWDRIPRAAVERVEIEQGGASQAYGSGALSGAIEVFARKPSQDWLVMESSGGTRTTPEGSVFAGRQIGNWEIWGSGGGYGTEGFIPTPAANRGTVDTAASSRDANGMMSLARDYHSGSLRLSGQYFNESRDNGTPLQTNATEIGEGSAHLSQNVNGGVLSGVFYGSGQSYDQSFSSIATNRDSESLTRLQHVPAQRVGGGLQWSNQDGGKHRWTIGTDMQQVHGTSLETGFAGGNATSKSSAGGTQRYLGIFAQDSLRMTSRVILTGGLRVDHWSNTDAALVTQTLATGVVARQPFADRGENFVSPHASLLVRLSNAAALTFSGSRAFRAPTLNELYRSFRLGNVLTNANSALTAEQLYGGEGGVLVNVKRVQLRAVGFAYQVIDPVANVTLTSTAALISRQRQNLGETSSRGIDLSAGTTLTSQWSLNAGYQYTRALVSDFPADVTLVGRRIPQVPAHAFTFQTAFTNRDWTLSAQGRASGNQFDDDQNVFALGSAFSLDAMLAKRFSSGVTVFLAGQNLTNERYLTARTPVPQEGAGIGGRVGVRIELPSRLPSQQ